MSRAHRKAAAEIRLAAAATAAVADELLERAAMARGIADALESASPPPLEDARVRARLVLLHRRNDR
jgi:hypothetical protein